MTDNNEFEYAGSVSWGTLRSQDLIDSFIDALWDLNRERASEIIKEYFGDWNTYRNTDLESWCDDNPDDSSWLINEVLFDALNECAPENYYFGAHPGDGANFGFWPIETLD